MEHLHRITHLVRHESSHAAPAYSMTWIIPIPVPRFTNLGLHGTSHLGPDGYSMSWILQNPRPGKPLIHFSSTTWFRVYKQYIGPL